MASLYMNTKAYWLGMFEVYLHSALELINGGDHTNHHKVKLSFSSHAVNRSTNLSWMRE